MFTLTPWKKQSSASGNGGALAPTKEYPFFLGRMRDEFDRLFERFSHDWPWYAEEGNAWRWGLEVKDEDNAFLVEAAAPGFEPGDFDIQVRGNQLILRAAHKTEKKTQEGKVEEYQEQQCYESVTLPPGIDENKIAAKYHSGMLTITVPKTEAGKGKKVPVKAG
jgi:HSP20 family protein